MEDHPPSFFLCPISGELMRDPVTLRTGHTYDRDYIEKWLESRPTCPNSGQILEEKYKKLLIPCRVLKDMISNWEVNRITIVEEGQNASRTNIERKKKEDHRAQPPGLSIWATATRLPVIGVVLQVAIKYLENSEALSSMESMCLNIFLFILGLALSLHGTGLQTLLAAIAGYAIRKFLKTQDEREIRAALDPINAKIKNFLAEIPKSGPGMFFGAGVLMTLMWRLTSTLPLFLAEVGILTFAMSVAFFRADRRMRLTKSEKHMALMMNLLIVVAFKLVLTVLTFTWGYIVAPCVTLFVYLFGHCWIFILFSPIEGPVGFFRFIMALLPFVLLLVAMRNRRLR